MKQSKAEDLSKIEARTQLMTKVEKMGKDVGELLMAMPIVWFVVGVAMAGGE